MILPKIHSTTDLDYVSDAVAVARHQLEKPFLSVIPSIESAKGMWNLGSIASWKSSHGGIAGGTLNALLVSPNVQCIVFQRVDIL